MGLKSDLTVNLGAEFSEITKGIRIFSRKIGESLSDSIAKGISNPINKFKGELVKLKVSFSVPAGQFKKVDEMAKRISDTTHVKPELDLKRANKQLSDLRGQILGTYSTFISKPVSASIDFNNAINEINRFADLSTKELSIDLTKYNALKEQKIKFELILYKKLLGIYNDMIGSVKQMNQKELGIFELCDRLPSLLEDKETIVDLKAS
ncbi:hypothetical protein BKH42_05400 [Helicobacter sp. 13S00482-2]|uniref:hypothetical protein n=1 Tax=Helicobacter sp. 13S00482-2 TaxID=1476200 RepID=UPI000BA54DA4|nr:hypothetical protein [Helicobacter sp. 13S00482-2]PAF53487.1 hypothetical protein BKH42_05400 [Helicobacter sp. 13S00482-2]